MTKRLALIVDDSRSARHILSRMLESFGLEVVSVESAELALTYLQGARPDVIFMDHLMPGMDGFSAVKVLKANPDTATIPVLMYTSQEGEMYLSQARALGAMGVLPKTLKHADVAAALQQLSLLSAAATDKPASAVPPVRATAPAPILVEPVLAHDNASAERAVQSGGESSVTVSPAGVPQLAHRIAAEVRDELQQVAVQSALRLNFWRALAALSGVACVGLLVWVLVLQNQMRQQLADLQRMPFTAQTSAAATPAAAIVSSEATATPAAELSVDALPVAYGEVPYSGTRLEHLRELLARYADDPRRLVIRIESASADFCLHRTDAGIYEPALDDTLLSACDLVGNPFNDALSVQQRQSVAFANLLATVNSDAGRRINVQLADNGRQANAVYPARSATLTAGEWNRVAERNQQVTFTVAPAP